MRYLLALAALLLAGCGGGDEDGGYLRSDAEGDPLDADAAAAVPRTTPRQDGEGSASDRPATTTL